MDLLKVVKKEHLIAEKAHQPCSGIIYVHKRSDTDFLVARINQVNYTTFSPTNVLLFIVCVS